MEIQNLPPQENAPKSKKIYFIASGIMLGLVAIGSLFIDTSFLQGRLDKNLNERLCVETIKAYQTKDRYDEKTLKNCKRQYPGLFGNEQEKSAEKTPEVVVEVTPAPEATHEPEAAPETEATHTPETEVVTETATESATEVVVEPETTTESATEVAVEPEPEPEPVVISTVFNQSTLKTQYVSGLTKKSPTNLEYDPSNKAYKAWEFKIWLPELNPGNNNYGYSALVSIRVCSEDTTVNCEILAESDLYVLQNMTEEKRKRYIILQEYDYKQKLSDFVASQNTDKFTLRYAVVDPSGPILYADNFYNLNYLAVKKAFDLSSFTIETVAPEQSEITVLPESSETIDMLIKLTEKNKNFYIGTDSKYILEVMMCNDSTNYQFSCAKLYQYVIEGDMLAWTSVESKIFYKDVYKILNTFPLFSNKKNPIDLKFSVRVYEEGKEGVHYFPTNPADFTVSYINQ